VNAHRSCAHRLWLVCDRYRSLLGEIEDGLLDTAGILQRRDELSAQVHAAYDQGFSLDQNAYEGARQMAEHTEHTEAGGDEEGTDERHDVLPASLHANSAKRAPKDPVSH
jgi:conflict system pore-forming effector with SLATT domain